MERVRSNLRIGEAARLLGVSAKTIRHYQKVGLLAEPRRTAAGYRLYGGEELLRLLRIRRLTALGLPLAQIRSLLAEEGDREPLRRALEELRAGIEAEIRRLSERRTAIDRLLAMPATSGMAGLDEPRRPPEEVDSALVRLREQLTGVDPAVLDQALELDRRMLGLLYELQLPKGSAERLREVLDRLAADPSPLSALLPLLARWTALAAETDESAPEVEALGRELAAALPRELAGGAGLAGAPLGNVFGELARGALSPAQGRILDRLRERLAEQEKRRPADRS
jgi:DNA-binding transcriptional MerR regulator